MAANTTLEEALEWIVGYLDRGPGLYQVAGGLAAKCYGADRPLHDIDIYVPGKSLKDLAVGLSGYTEFGPEYHQDEHWRIVFMKLHYKGWQIELADAGQTAYFDYRANQWIKEEIDFKQSVRIEFKGIILPVMPKDRLIAYKQRLDREVDRLDVACLKKHNT